MNYPDFQLGADEHIVYYAEFDRGFQKNTFTIFRRTLFPKSKHETGDSYPAFLLQSREAHPYQLFSGFCNEGCIPDQTWVKWMVDALNEKAAGTKI